MIDLDGKADWCLSGGADGSDLEWGYAAAKIGQGVVHFSFEGHRTLALPSEVVVLTEAMLMDADQHCQRANLTLKRKFPAKALHTTNLLRRDWYQVGSAEACYAVSTLQIPVGATIPLDTLISHGEVKGGTAWAVQMFIDRHDGAACACYLFDQKLCHWFQWNGDGWKCIYEPPKPTGVYAGVGARALLPIGKMAIRLLMSDETN